MKKSPREMTEPPEGYQTTKEELEEPININVPGKTVKEKLERLAKAVTRTVKKPENAR